MDAITCIRTRRSIRKFEDKPVEESVIRDIISDCSLAPSWKNFQPVRYVAVTDPEIRAKIANDCVLGFTANANVIAACPVLMVVTLIHGRSGFERDGSYSTSKEDRWEVFDAGIATQTLCLAAHARGIGSVVMGIFDEKRTAEVLQLPEGQIVAALVPMGYPAQEGTVFKRKTVDELVRFL